MASRVSFVELDDSGQIIRIFRTFKAGRQFVGNIAKRPHALAVKEIRLAVFCRDGYACTHCGDSVTFDTGHMHERKWRGRGGEISLANSVTLCAACHLNNKTAGHGQRQTKWRGRK